MSHDSTPSAESLLAAALEYHGRGWSLLPMAVTPDGDGTAGEKKPARKWKPYQSRRATLATIRRWCADPRVNGIAVVFGPVSGGLVSRDYDALDAYQAWADRYPDLAGSLPTIATRRGRQVLCIAAAGSVEAIRAELGKANGTGAIALGDGELRAGPGCYSLLPPSVHPSGIAYTWLIPPTDEFPILDLRQAGFLDGGQTPTPHITSTTPSPSHVSDRGFCDEISAAIEATLPRQIGERHRRVFDFARRLKAVAQFAGATVEELEPHVRRWHAQAVATPMATKAWPETWLDFSAAWNGAKYPAGRTALTSIMARADASERPAVARAFGDGPLARLIALCAELQRENGDAPFPLSTAAVAAALGTDFRKVADLLNGLCAAGILRRESEFRFPGKAAEYRYLPPL